MRQVTASRSRPRAAGFTLIEVMIAMLLGMVGLLGTLAVQQSIFNATANGADAAIAGRLATRSMEELTARVLDPGPPVVDQLAAVAGTAWSPIVYVGPDGGTNASQTPVYRFQRQFRVVNLGVGQPYNISVQVSFALDTGRPKVIRFDQQRWKTW